MKAAVRYLVVGAVSLFAIKGGLAQKTDTVSAAAIADVQRQFAAPPDDARPMMRWWWFGPGVEKPELEREILAMKAGGIGGFEIQPVYPLAMDDTGKHYRNLPYLSDEFLDAVKFASATARKNNMRVDMTLASGWPYGGPNVPVNEASARLRVVTTDVPAGAASLATPSLANGETLLAMFSGAGTAAKFDADKMERLSGDASGARLDVAPQPAPRVVMFFIESRTGQQVKRAALNAEGFVLDHYSRAALDHHLHTVGEKLMKAFGDTPPYAVFSDSLEVYNADWTDDLLTEFARRRGYDLTPYLPQLFTGGSAMSASLRHDWGITLTELVDERYLTPLNDWANAHHTRFRSQTYGEPPVSMSSNRLVALPEGEGPQWNSFSFTRWATSASHIYGRPVTSAETWTWLHSPAFRATPLDMKAEADCFFLEGVNQLIGHGWPYTPLVAPEPGWAFYAAAVFNDHNPWWGVMPDITKYLQRVSYLLRQGKPANDVAVLLPNDDVYAEMTPGHATLSGDMRKYVTPALMRSLLGAGYNVDYIDAESIKEAGISYPVVVLPHVDRMSPETLKALTVYAAHGGRIIAVGAAPARAPGFLHAEEVTADVQGLSRALFADTAHTQLVAQDADTGSAIRAIFPADMKLTADLNTSADGVGFLHRKLDDGDIYFVANTTNHDVHTSAEFRSKRKLVSWWDPFSGVVRAYAPGPIHLDLAPYESRIVVFSDAVLVLPQTQVTAQPRLIGDLTRGWKVRFPVLGKDSETLVSFDAPTSWTDDPKTRFYSGEAVYTKTFSLEEAQLRGTKRLLLDFGEGTPVTQDPAIRSGMRALLEGPVREAAIVFINGERMGSVWHPPYQLDITRALHSGENTVEIRVSNTAINHLAGRAPIDYTLLWGRYTQRFIPQNMDHLEPLRSGILGGVHLMEVR